MSIEATTPMRTGDDAEQPDPAVSPRLSLTGVTRRFNGVTAVDDVNLEIQPGEIFALLGPSGCGKSTTLRMVAGLEKIDAGTIAMSDRVLADAGRRRFLPPEKRDIAMVFQAYAVWPHMTVEQNVGFPLRMRRVRRAERRRRVAEILEVTGLGAMADRPATMLSGGQQQRVALARALVYTPDLLLLDEPLSNLDAKLRVQMRREIRRLNQELGVTMLFVTHDQDEALSLADRLAVMNRGRVEQIGTPADLYERPATPFVRDFLGRLIVVDGVARAHGGTTDVRLDIDGQYVGDLTGVMPTGDVGDGDRVGVYLRPEDVEVTALPPGGAQANQILARVVAAVYLGDSLEYTLDIGGRHVVLTTPRRSRHEPGDDVLIHVDADHAMVWPL
jgi:ABC-type Fe3+/spermidine/putrescine transport system ATPase subunit